MNGLKGSTLLFLLLLLQKWPDLTTTYIFVLYRGRTKAPTYIQARQQLTQIECQRLASNTDALFKYKYRPTISLLCSQPRSTPEDFNYCSPTRSFSQTTGRREISDH
jgi:hypothetical protein